MSWTYDDTDPTALDRIRTLVGDTNSKDQLVTNEVINRLITEYPTERAAAVQVLRRILAKTAPRVDRNAGSINSQQSQAWESRSKLLDQLLQDGMTECEGYAGGQSHSEKETQFANKDYVANWARIVNDGDTPCSE